MTTTLANQLPRINLANGGSVQSAKVVSRNLDNRTLPRLTRNCQCTHLSFVQAQHYRVALESRAIRKLNHKSETVRIKLRARGIYEMGCAGAMNFTFGSGTPLRRPATPDGS